MELDRGLVERTFDALEKQFGSPVDPTTEVTASMLYALFPDVCQRTHLNRLKAATKRGEYTMRVAKQGELAFKEVENGTGSTPKDS